MGFGWILGYVLGFLGGFLGVFLGRLRVFGELGSL